jgi:hypothetical protein
MEESDCDKMILSIMMALSPYFAGYFSMVSYVKRICMKQQGH